MTHTSSFIRFILRAAAIPAAAAAIAIGAYVWADPFRVVRSYDNYYVGQPVQTGRNKAHISLSHFLQHRDSLHYNAFIIGSSLAITYPVEAWRGMLPPGASPFHFDASAASPRTLRLITEYLATHSDLDHALIVLPVERTTDLPANTLTFINPPPIDPEVSAWRWHWTFIKSAFNREFLRSYISSMLLGRRNEPAGKTYISIQPIVEEPLTNQETIPEWDRLIDSDPIRFLHTIHPDELPMHDNSRLTLPKSYTRADSIEFATMANILRLHNTDYHIIVSPRRDKVQAPSADISMLKAVFGEDRVIDASGIDFDQISDFYDSSHYRPSVAVRILSMIQK